MDLLTALDQTFAHADGVIAGMRPEQLDDPTPCERWTVRDLLEHMIGVVDGIGASVSGEVADRPFELGLDPAAQFREVSAATLAAWRSPGKLDEVIDGGPGPMPGRVLAGINLLDTATHTWDLAAATGQPPALPDAVAIAALDVSQQIVSPELRTGRFGPEVTACEGAGPTDRLVAFLGRRP